MNNHQAWNLISIIVILILIPALLDPWVEMRFKALLLSNCGNRGAINVLYW